MGMPWSLVFCSVLLASEPLSATVAPSPVRRGQGHLMESPVLCWNREKPDSSSLQTSVFLLVTVTGKEKHLHRRHNSFLSLASGSQITHFFCPVPSMQVYLRAGRWVGLPQARISWDHVSSAGVCCFLLGVNELSSCGWSGNGLVGKRRFSTERRRKSVVLCHQDRSDLEGGQEEGDLHKDLAMTPTLSPPSPSLAFSSWLHPPGKRKLVKSQIQVCTADSALQKIN